MKRKKRRARTKAEIITAVLYGIFGLLVVGVLYGAGRGAYALMGETIGNHYYTALAEKRLRRTRLILRSLPRSIPKCAAGCG